MASAVPDTIIEPDDTISDEGYAESTTTSYVTSIASGVRKGIQDPYTGRYYAAYGQHLPALPIDDHEVSETPPFVPGRALEPVERDTVSLVNQSG